MTIENLKALVDGFSKVPHGESTLSGQRCLHCVCEASRKEIEALERLATGWASQTTLELMGGKALAQVSAMMDRIAKEAP